MISDVLRICKLLLFSHPFYGSVLLSLNKEINKGVPTAGVGLQGVMYKLYINPDFWDSLSEKHKTGLILHELGHIVFFHCTDYNHLKDKKIANIAKDIYINQLIPADMLPDGGCTWDKYPEANLVANMDTNWYYKKLTENAESNCPDPTLENQMGAGDGDTETTDGKGNPIEIPQHNWDEIEDASEATKKILQKTTEALLSDIIKTLGKDAGDIPGNLVEILDQKAVIEPPKFNWKQYLRRFVGTSTKTWVNKTRRKKSKRFVGQPGQKEFYFSHILVAIDTSFSVSTPEVEEFLNEIQHMNKTGHDVDIVLCDTQIRDHFRYNPRKPFEIKGRGGTKFQPVIDLYNKNLKKYSCLIYLSDGEARSPINAKGQILWVHSSVSHLNDSLPGKCIKLN